MLLWLLLDSNTTLVIKLMCQRAVLTGYVTRPLILPPQSKIKKVWQSETNSGHTLNHLCHYMYFELYCYHYLLVVEVVKKTEL